MILAVSYKWGRYGKNGTQILNVFPCRMFPCRTSLVLHFTFSHAECFPSEPPLCSISDFPIEDKFMIVKLDSNYLPQFGNGFAYLLLVQLFWCYKLWNWSHDGGTWFWLCAKTKSPSGVIVFGVTNCGIGDGRMWGYIHLMNKSSLPTSTYFGGFARRCHSSPKSIEDKAQRTISACEQVNKARHWRLCTIPKIWQSDTVHSCKLMEQWTSIMTVKKDTEICTISDKLHLGTCKLWDELLTFVVLKYTALLWGKKLIELVLTPLLFILTTILLLLTTLWTLIVYPWKGKSFYAFLTIINTIEPIMLSFGITWFEQVESWPGFLGVITWCEAWNTITKGKMGVWIVSMSVWLDNIAFYHYLEWQTNQMTMGVLGVEPDHLHRLMCHHVHSWHASQPSIDITCCEAWNTITNGKWGCMIWLQE